jgi:hypothetical protein
MLRKAAKPLGSSVIFNKTKGCLKGLNLLKKAGLA